MAMPSLIPDRRYLEGRDKLPEDGSPSGLESLSNIESSDVGNSSSISVSGSTSGATPSSGTANFSVLTPPIAMQSSWGGAAQLAETTVRRRGNGQISSSRRDTGNNGGRQSCTMAPCRSEGSWTVKVGSSPTDSSRTRTGRIR